MPASQTNEGGKSLLARPADGLVGIGSCIPVALLWSSPALFSIAILSPCLLVHLQAPRNAPHQPQHRTHHLVHCSFQPIPQLPAAAVGQALERSPQSLPIGTTPRLLHRPLRPQQRRPLPLPLPQSTPDHHSRCRHNQSLLNSPPAPSHRRPDPIIPACRPPPTLLISPLCEVRRSQASRLGKPFFAAALPFRPPPTAPHPAPLSNLSPTADYNNVHDPDNADHNNSTPQKNRRRSTPHPHNGGENGALQAGGAG